MTTNDQPDEELAAAREAVEGTEYQWSSDEELIGEPLAPPTGDQESIQCCLCGTAFVGYGNNPDPLADGSKFRCCDDCNTERVIPARLKRIGDTLGGNPMIKGGDWVMVGQWRASDGSTEVEGMYLETYDPEAFDGRGAATWTENADDAMRFETAMAVLQFWRQQSKVRPLRGDGEANRPLTAYTVEPRNLR